jgi:hypothetical protein
VYAPQFETPATACIIDAQYRTTNTDVCGGRQCKAATPACHGPVACTMPDPDEMNREAVDFEVGILKTIRTQGCAKESWQPSVSR